MPLGFWTKIILAIALFPLFRAEGRLFNVTNVNDTTNWHWTFDAQERGRGLPLGIPRMVDTNGSVESIDLHFSTQAYHDEAGRLMVQEANHAAQALNLVSDQSNADGRIKWVNVTPFGFFYLQGLMGYVSTTNYTYRFLEGGKLTTIELDHSYEVWRALQDKLLPEDHVSNAAAYQLATQWLASLSVDVAGLNRDCQLTVAPSPVFNYVGSGKEPIQRMFAPTYNITWMKSNDPTAFVQLYLPDKMLIQLSIHDQKYNLRPPLTFTNLSAIFPGQARIVTNYPITPVEVSFPAMPQEITFVTDSKQPEPKFHDLALNNWIEAKTELNAEHLSLSKLMTLKRVSGPDEWGVVAFDLPVRFEALHYHSEQPFPSGVMDLGSLDKKGNFVEFTLHDCEKAPDGNTRISWNINWNSPGKHEVRARMMFACGMDGDQFNLIGPSLSYYSSNTCRFYESSTLFTGEGADLYAKLREPSAKFRVEVRSLKGRLVNVISSNTTNGEINLAWDLTRLDGKKYTNNSFIGSFFVVFPDDTHTNAPVKARFNKIGTAGDQD